MVKKQQKQRLQVPVSPKTNPVRETLSEIEQVLSARQSGQIDDWDAAPRIRQIAERIGCRRAFDELVNRVLGPDGKVRPGVAWAVGLVGGSSATSWLWEVIRTPHRSLAARRAAIVALEGQGARISTEDLPDDLIFRIYGNLGRLAEVIGNVEEADTPLAVELALLPFHQLLAHPPEEGRPGGKELAAAVCDQVLRYSENKAGANFLKAVVETTDDPDIRELAEKALSRLRAIGIEPESPAVLGLSDQRFHKAFAGSTPGDPSTMEVVVAWESGVGSVSTLIFYIDRQNLPGSLVNVHVEPGVPEQDFRRRYVERAWLSGQPLRDISLVEARDLVARGVETNVRHNRPQPEGFDLILPIIERRVLRAGEPAGS